MNNNIESNNIEFNRRVQTVKKNLGCSNKLNFTI